MSEPMLGAARVREVKRFLIDLRSRLSGTAEKFEACMCPKCGALVLDEYQHENWHAHLRSMISEASTVEQDSEGRGGLSQKDGRRRRMRKALPFTKILKFCEAEPGETMEFRLIYRGPLPSEKCEQDPADGMRRSGRAKDKHAIRKSFHPQMRELWSQHPDLRKQADSWFVPVYESGKTGAYVYQVFPKDTDPRPLSGDVKSHVDRIADDHQRCGGRFVPLISEAGGFTCALDILFLRRDNPGNLIDTGGDVDNRIKVLLDGLRMPKTNSELGGYEIDENDENPFYCLLEDDKLITQISITTDRLVIPPTKDEGIHNVLLVVHVTVVNPSALKQVRNGDSITEEK